MKVTIPVAGVELDSTGTNRIYQGQLPVWSTRPLTITCEPDFDSGVGYDMTVRVVSGGGFTDESTKVFPFAFKFDIDLSFAAFFLNRADRNKSEYIPDGYVEIWSKSKDNRIKIPLFHADLTYWHTIGVQSSLPQPPKPRIYGQTLDILFPFRVDRNTSYKVEAEPVDGYPSTAIFPVAYTPGETIDIQYIKKLTIKNLFGEGLDYTIDYENRLHTSVGEDPAELCALRARWNMQNGQWFWASFKDFYWTNKFTTIRGRGGVTEQAILTVNLEYGKEWYEVYQQLLTSSNIMFNLAIDGISQYADKSFRAEVSGDTGARWSNSTKTYRQQVQFRTIELQDNYLFPESPDHPEKPGLVWSAQYNPWNNKAGKRYDAWNNITANADWYVESEPDWYAVTMGTQLFTSDMFEQGGFDLWGKGKHYSQWKTASDVQIRLKEPVYTLGEVYSLIGMADGYLFQVLYVDENGLATDEGGPSYAPINTGRRNLAGGKGGFMLRFIKSPSAPITPGDVTAMALRYGKRYWTGKAGTQYIEGYMLANVAASERTGTLSLKSLAGEQSYAITVKQDATKIQFSKSEVKISRYSRAALSVNTLEASTAWEFVGYPTWAVPTALTGEKGTGISVKVKVQENTGATRTANITVRSAENPSVQRSFRIVQAGTNDNIKANVTVIQSEYVAVKHKITINSFGNWSVSERDPLITPDRYDHPGGEVVVTLTIQDNDKSNDSRLGKIQFYDHITGTSVNVTVVQQGAPSTIGALPFRLTYGRDEETQDVMLTAQNNWAVHYKPAWASVDSESGTPDDTSLLMTVEENTTGATREDYVKIRDTVSGDVTVVLLIQNG